MCRSKSWNSAEKSLYPQPCHTRTRATFRNSLVLATRAPFTGVSPKSQKQSQEGVCKKVPKNTRESPQIRPKSPSPETLVRDAKTAQRERFRAGYPADVLGSFVRTSRVKKLGQALQILERQAFGRGSPSPGAWVGVSLFSTTLSVSLSLSLSLFRLPLSPYLLPLSPLYLSLPSLPSLLSSFTLSS